MGGDVSKGYCDFVVVDHQQQIVEKTFQIDDSFHGHNALITYVQRFFSSHANATLCVGFESTGGYENNWYNLFIQLRDLYDINVTRLNPKGVKHHHKALMQRTVTDSVAAYSIATYLISYKKKITYNTTSSHLEQLRRQWVCIKLAIKQRNQLLNSLNSLMYQSNPELLMYCRNGIPSWVLNVLNLYPTAKRLGGARAKSLVKKILYLNLDKANMIINKAKSSIASHVDHTDEFIIRQLVHQIKHLDEVIEAHKMHLEKNCQLPEVDLLSSFKGIGKYSAVGLLLNIVSIARFSSAKKLASFWGVHPKYRKSGDGTWGHFMSKEGRAEPRAILFMVALNAIKFNPLIKELFEKKVKQGMRRKVAIGVCMHKIVRIIYGMLRTNSMFDSAIDLKNQISQKNYMSKKRIDKSRRFQQIDKDAPVSNRQNKNRKKKDEKPQRINNPENGVNPIHNMVKNSKRITKDGNKKDMEKIGEIIERMMVNRNLDYIEK